MEKFNYCITTNWPENNMLSVYRVHNRDVHYGNIKDAEYLLDYVKYQSPGKSWRIVKLLV
jgi:hypothetical protein